MSRTLADIVESWKIDAAQREKQSREGSPVSSMAEDAGEGMVARRMQEMIAEVEPFLPLPQSVEPLFISPQCKTGFKGEWIKPAKLTEAETNEILDRLPKEPRRDMYRLLVTEGNRMAERVTSNTKPFHDALKSPVGGKYYRLAKGTDRAGRYKSQLWEVQPDTR